MDYFKNVEIGLVKNLKLDKAYRKSEQTQTLPRTLDYSDHNGRIDFINKKFTANSSGMYCMLTNENFPAELIDHWKKKKVLNVVSYGAGPGSDLIGFQEFCTLHNIKADLIAFDTEMGWHRVISQLNFQCKTDIKFIHIQEDFDSNVQYLIRCDVLILSHVIPLIKSASPTEFVQSVLKSLPETTLLIRDRFGINVDTNIGYCKQIFIDDVYRNTQQIVLYNELY